MKCTIKQKCGATYQENIFNAKFKLNELTQATASLCTKKNPGCDFIMAEPHKYRGPTALSTCVKLFNQIWTKTVAAMSRRANIIHLLAEKKRRGLKIIQVSTNNTNKHSSKTIEKIINVRLNWYLETENLLSPAQAGFRRQCPTNKQITMLGQEITDCTD
jgi:hypothetical protein